MKRCGMTRRDDREDGIQRQRQTELDTGNRLQRIKLWTIAMQSLIEEALHSQLLMVHFLHTKKPLKQRLVSRPSTMLCLSRSLSLQDS